MAQLFSDSLNGTDATLLTAYSANYSNVLNSMEIANNGTISGAGPNSAGNDCAVRRNDITPADAHQYVEVTYPSDLGTRASGAYAGGAIRMSATADTWVGFYVNSGSGAGGRIFILEHSAGTATTLYGTANNLIPDGAVVKLEIGAANTTLVSINGVLQDGAGATTDLRTTTTVTSTGSIGTCGYGFDANNTIIDSIVGGDYAATSATISTVPSTVARGETGLTITGTSFGAIEGTLTFGGELCTVTLWTDTSITFTVPSTINLLYATATHAFVVTADDTTSDTSAAVPFTPESGRSYVALVSPVYSSNQYLAYGYEGTPAPVSTDQLEYPDSTTPDAITFTVNADSEWILDSMPTSTQTVQCQIIRAATSVRSATWTVTYSVAGGGTILPLMMAYT